MLYHYKIVTESKTDTQKNYAKAVIYDIHYIS